MGKIIEVSKTIDSTLATLKKNKVNQTLSGIFKQVKKTDPNLTLLGMVKALKKANGLGLIEIKGTKYYLKRLQRKQIKPKRKPQKDRTVKKPVKVRAKKVEILMEEPEDVQVVPNQEETMDDDLIDPEDFANIRSLQPWGQQPTLDLTSSKFFTKGVSLTSTGLENYYFAPHLTTKNEKYDLCLVSNFK